MNETLTGLRPEQRDALRLLGAVAFGAGAMALFVRKSSQDQWAAFPKLLLLAIPCALLYGLGTGAIRLGRGEDTPADVERALPAWRAAALTFGLIFVPFTLLQLAETLGGDPDKAGHNAWVFLATALAGAYASLVHGLRWGALFGGVALIVSWLSFWEAITDPSGTAIRWFFLIIGGVLLAAALALRASRRREADELVTAAGLAGLAAGITGLLVVIAQFAVSSVASALGGDADLSGTQQRQEWDVFLLVLALALIWYGLRAAWRGPAYVGAIALFAFIVSVGSEVTALFSGDGPGGDLVGWPLLLLVLGGAALFAGLYGGDRDGAAAAQGGAGWQAGHGGEPPPTEPLPPTQPPPPGPPQP